MAISTQSNDDWVPVADTPANDWVPVAPAAAPQSDWIPVSDISQTSPLTLRRGDASRAIVTDQDRADMDSALTAPTRALAKGIGYLGNIGRGVVLDLIHNPDNEQLGRNPKSNENLNAALADEPLPAMETLKKTGGVPGFTERLMVEAPDMVLRGLLTKGLAGTGGLVAHSAAAGVAFGLDENSSTGLNPKTAAIMAGMPIASELGAQAVAKAINATVKGQQVVERNIVNWPFIDADTGKYTPIGTIIPKLIETFKGNPLIEGNTAQKALETIIGRGGATAAYLTAVQLPEIKNLPDDQKLPALANAAGMGIVTAILDMPGVLKKNVASTARMQLAKRIMIEAIPEPSPKPVFPGKKQIGQGDIPSEPEPITPAPKEPNASDQVSVPSSSREELQGTGRPPAQTEGGAPARVPVEQVAPPPEKPQKESGPSAWGKYVTIPKHLQGKSDTEIQKLIDQRENELEAQGHDPIHMFPHGDEADLYPPGYIEQPKDLSELYAARDSAYLESRKEGYEAMRKAVGLSDKDTTNALDLLGFMRPGQGGITAYFDTESAKRFTSGNRITDILNHLYTHFEHDQNAGHFHWGGTADSPQIIFSSDVRGGRLNREALGKAIKVYNGVANVLNVSPLNPDFFTNKSKSLPEEGKAIDIEAVKVGESNGKQQRRKEITAEKQTEGQGQGRGLIPELPLEPTPTPAPAPKRGAAFQRAMANMSDPHTLLEAIKTLGGIASPRQTDQAKLGDYDGYSEAVVGAVRALRRTNGGQKPDDLRDQLNSMGFKFESTSDMWAAIQRAGEASLTAGERQKKSEAQDKNQGDLMSSQTEDMALVGEKGVDWDKRAKEKAAAEQAKREADELAAKQQQVLFPGGEKHPLTKDERGDLAAISVNVLGETPKAVEGQPEEADKLPPTGKAAIAFQLSDGTVIFRNRDPAHWSLFEKLPKSVSDRVTSKGMIKDGQYEVGMIDPMDKPMFVISAKGTPIAWIRARSKKEAMDEAFRLGMGETKLGRQTDAFTAEIDPEWDASLRSVVVPKQPLKMISDATGSKALREWANDPKNGLSPEVKAVIEDIMRNPALEQLRIALFNRGPSGFAAAFSPVNGIAITRATTPEQIQHEVFHAFWEMLPEADKAVIEQYRRIALEQRFPDGIPSHYANGMTSKEFQAALKRGIVQIDDYHLSNANEFGANQAAHDWSKAKNTFWQRIKELWQAFLDALKRAFGKEPNADQIIREMKAGMHQFRPATEEGDIKGTVAENAQVAERALQRDKLDSQALHEEEARGIGAQVAFPIRKIQEIGKNQGVDPIILENALKELGYPDMENIATVASVVPLEEFNHGVVRLKGTTLLHVYAREVAFKFRLIEEHMKEVVANGEKAEKEFLAKAPKLGKRADEVELRLDQLKAARKLFTDGAAADLQTAKELLAKQVEAQGRGDAVAVGQIEVMLRRAAGLPTDIKPGSFEVGPAGHAAIAIASAKSARASALESAIRDMIDTLVASAPHADVLFNLTSQDAAALFNAYKAAKPHGGPEEMIVRWAADTLARANILTKQMAALASARLVSQVRDAVTAHERDLLDAFEKNPRAIARKIARKSVAQGKQISRAEEAIKILHRDLYKAIDDYATATTAANMAAEFVSDPETKAYKKLSFQLGKMEDRPRHAIDFWSDSIRIGEGIPLPDGTFTAPIMLTGNTAAFANDFNTFNQALNHIAGAIPTLENPTEQQYWMKRMRYLTDVMTTSRMWAPTKFVTPLDKIWGINRVAGPLGMTKFAMDVIGTRAASKAKHALAVHARSVELGMDLVHNNQSAIAMAATRAGQSHGFDKKRGLNDGALYWHEEIGNELFASWQSKVAGYGVGDMINGNVVNQADMHVLRLQAQVTRNGFGIVQRGIPESMHAEPVYFKTSIGGSDIPAIVMSIEPSEFGVPRTLNRDVFNLAGQYVKSPPAERWDMLNSYFRKIVRTYIKDRRNVSFDGVSQFEDQYAVLKIAFNKGTILGSDHNMGWLVDQLSGSTGIVRGEVAKALLAEFDGVMKRLHDQLLKEEEENKGVKVEAAKKDSSFTKSRKDALAGSWLYDYGWKNHAALLNFGMAIQGHYYERALLDMVDVLDDLIRVRGNMRKELAAATATGGLLKPAMGKLSKENARDVKLGKTFDDYEHIERHINALNTMIEMFRDIYGAGKSIDTDIQTARTLIGAGTGATLMGQVTAIRNAGYGWVYLGRLMNNLTGAGHLMSPVNYAHAVYELWLKQIPKYVGSAMLSVPMMATRGVYRGAKDLKVAFINEHERHLNVLFGRFFAPLVREMAVQTFERIAQQRELESMGLAPGSVVDQDFLAKFTLPMQGGVIRSEPIFSSTLGNLGYGLFEMLVDAPLLTAIGKPMLPALTDRALNEATMKIGRHLANKIEDRLRKVFGLHAAAGTLATRFDLANPGNPKNYLLPEELFGTTRGMLFKRAKHVTDLQHVREFFEHSGMNLDLMAMRFMAELAAGHIDAKLFTPTDVIMFGDLMVQDTNKGMANNSPLQLKKKDLLWQLVGILQRWNIHTLRASYVRAFARAKVSPDMSKAMLWAAVAMLVFPYIMAAGGAASVGIEEIIRIVKRRFSNEIRPTRQPWEEQNQIKGWGLAIANAIPVLQTIANMLFNDSPGRASADMLLVAQSKVINVARYLGGAVQTHDMLFGLPQLMKGLIPISDIFVNELPFVEGTVESLNARRAWTRYGPSELLQDRQMAPSQNLTVLSPYGAKMENALMKGDDAEFLRVYNEAVEAATKLGVDHPDRAAYQNPEKLVQQMLKSRDPETRAFKQRLTDEQRQAVLDKASPDARQAMETAADRFRHAEELVGTTPPGERVASGGGAGTSGAPAQAVAGGAMRSRGPGMPRLSRLGAGVRLRVGIGRVRSAGRGVRFPRARALRLRVGKR